MFKPAGASGPLFHPLAKSSGIRYYIIYFTQAVMSELKQVSMDSSLECHDSIVLFFMAHGQQGIHADGNFDFVCY